MSAKAEGKPIDSYWIEILDDQIWANAELVSITYEDTELFLVKCRLCHGDAGKPIADIRRVTLSMDDANRLYEEYKRKTRQFVCTCLNNINKD